MSNRGFKKEQLDVRAIWTKIPAIPIANRAKLARLLERVLSAAWDQWLDTGVLPEGFELRVEWRNPDNANPRHANWKSSDDDDQSLEAARITLNRGGWLSREEMSWQL